MKRFVLFPALAISLILAGCASDATNGTSTQGSPATSASDQVTDMDDLMFLTMMIPHHEQAVEMSALAADQAEAAEVKAIAEAIGAAQLTEIAQMKQWLDESGQEVSGNHTGHMSGMVSENDMVKLRSLSGHEFDHEFLTLMVAHHEGAIDMARQVINGGESAKVRGLASSIDEVQRAEIRQMKALIEELSQHEGH